MATPKRKNNIGQPEIMVAEMAIGRDCVTFAFPKSILAQVSTNGKQVFYCVTGGIVQISGNVPSATMPAFALADDDFVPQVGQQ